MLTLKVKEKDNPLPCGITFELYSAEEIRKMSVVQIITPLSMNATGQGLPGGLYDPLMGPHNQNGKCGTCQRNLATCSGHFGHIELPLPVINPLFNKTVLQIFRLSCISCNSIIVPGAIKYLSIAQLKLLTVGLFNEALEAELIMSEIVAETEGDKGGENRRKSTANTVADTEFARTTFEKFVKKKLKRHKKRKLNETHQPNENINSSSTIIESIKQKTIKRILAYAKMQYKCQFCGTICKRMTQAESRILYSLSGVKANNPGRPRKDRSEDGDEMDVDDSPVADLDPIDIPSQKYLTPIEAKKHLQCVWLKEKDFLEYIFPVIRSAQTEFPTDVFFIDVLCVTPPKNRPSQTVNNIHVEHPHNLALRHVVSSCAMIQYILRAMRHGAESLSIESQRAVKSVNGESFQDKLENCWNELQADVDHVFDRDRNSKSNQATSQMIGLKQIIEKKEGLFRMNMMGKRVNFAARTVITPDPNINIDEIGIPDEFAKVLTFPCTVTPANVYHLRQLILNGPLKYPGAVAVKDENGVVSRLHPTDQAKRDGFANRLLVSDTLTKSSFTGVKTVYRHLQNGDLLLLNRQPSLHRPSIMAHRARVLTGEKVFRLHYANCKHYNADFDGDEMNAHFPQDEESRAEAAALVNVCNHFLVPKDGTPLAGLIQDHIVGAVKLSIRGRFFTRDDYHQLVFFALSNHHLKIETEPPTILKPVFLWSGKQVVSTIIKNLVPKGKAPLSFVSTTKIKSNEWRQWESRPCTFGGSIKEDELSESVVIFQKGELICGVLDKQHLGATPYGLCHSFFELYGSQAVGSLLSAFSRLLTSFLQWEGFTLGIKDVLVMPGADELRRYIMVKASSVGPEAAAKAVGIPLDSSDELIMTNLEAVHRSLDPKQRALVDLAYKQTLDKFTNKINGACLPYGLVTIFPANNLQLLVQSGAKGSTVNTMQMSCLLGQIELEGKRPPLTLAGKSLPSFKPYDMSPRAGGFILGRFLSGIRPQEFFFHCMAGREGLIDTAVKTSRSGYLQRCLVKLLEGVVTQYDMTVRDSDGTVIQFLYGEDGLDVSKSQFLKSKQLKFLEQNSNSVQSLKGTASRVSAMSQADQAELADRLDDVNFGKSQVKFWQDSSRRHEGKRGSEFLTFVKKNSKQFKSLHGFNSETGRSLKSEALIAKWQSLEDEDKDIYRKRSRRGPDPVLGKFSPTTMGVVSENLQKTLEDYTSDITFHDVVYSKAMEALSNPGDAVGVLAAQSIGEPSTQMTLNTFHFAGRGEMNVTLGIPRLREILMVASENIRTPCMDIPFQPHVTPEEAEALRIKLTRVSMSQVLENVEVTEKLDVRGHRIYQLKFRFLPFSEYGEDFYVKPNSILRYFEKDFLKSRFLVAFRRAQKLKKGLSGSSYLDATTADKLGGGGKNSGGGDDEYGPGAGDDYDDAHGDDENGGGRKNNTSRSTNRSQQQLSERQVGDLYQEAEKKGQGEEHESSDEEAEGDDDDATQARRHARTTEREYEEPEEEERLDDPDDALSIAGSTNSGRGRGQGVDLEDDLDEEVEAPDPDARSDLDFGAELEDRERRKRKFAVSRRNVELRRANVLALDPLLHAYSFDTKNQEWAQVTIRTAAHADKVNMGLLLKEISERAVIHQVPSINRAFTSSERGETRLKTEGVNILAMCEYNHLLDLTKLHCNNIHTMARHYGIEAALKVLIKELTDVFKAYGIVIDPRHLSLIADYMTTSGIYRPFSRIGITSSTSPLHQMSFETVVTFLRDATLSGKRDDLQNPSSRLIVGKNVNVGTELFDCLTPKSGLANDPDVHRAGKSRSRSSFAQSLFGDVDAKEEMKAKEKMSKKLSKFKLSQGATPIIYS